MEHIRLSQQRSGKQLVFCFFLYEEFDLNVYHKSYCVYGGSQVPSDLCMYCM